MQRAFEAALAELTLGPAIEANDAAGVSAWLERHDISGPDALCMARDIERLLVYRKLVRGTLRAALTATMPRALRRLGPRFEQDFDEFLLVSPPVTRSLRDLTPSFLDFCAARWADETSNVPAYLIELARHEALQVELASRLSPPETDVSPELALDRGVLFIDAVRLVHYTWAIHRLPELELEQGDEELPARAHVSLLVYRSPEHDVRYLELGRFASALLSGLLLERASLADALTRAADEVEQPLDDALLSRAARLLAELAERGALLGKREPSSSVAEDQTLQIASST